MVSNWHDKRLEKILTQESVEMEMRAMEKKLTKYDVERLGDIPLEREDVTMRVLVSQMGGCASMETRKIKIATTEQLIHKYDINLCTFMELNFNWTVIICLPGIMVT